MKNCFNSRRKSRFSENRLFSIPGLAGWAVLLGSVVLFAGLCWFFFHKLMSPVPAPMVVTAASGSLPRPRPDSNPNPVGSTSTTSPDAAPAATPRVLRVLLVSAEASLDPAVATDVQSLSITENIFDTLLSYDYLARPVRLQPNTLEAMPEVSQNGTRYILKIKRGIRFAPDPAFKGIPRELTAQDYVYSLTRLLDPAVKSPWRFLVAGKFVEEESANEKASATRPSGATMSVPGTSRKMVSPGSGGSGVGGIGGVSGIRALDRYTLELRLKQPDPNLLFQLAMPATAAVAREVIEAYPGQAGNHPIGTGPFKMGKWERSYKIELLANPDYHGRFSTAAADVAVDMLNSSSSSSSSTGTSASAATLLTPPSEKALDRTIAQRLQGKKLPLVDKVEIVIMEELQSRMLGLMRGDVDYLEQVPPALSGMVLEPAAHGSVRLKHEFVRKGMQLALFYPMQTYYMWMNMDDPVIGGITLDKIALRRAIAMSYDSDEDIRLLEQGLAMAAQSPLPPDVLGYDPAYRSPVPFNPALATTLLDKFGYRHQERNGVRDNWRSQPDGQPLHLVMHTLASTTGRMRDEIWRKNLERIGIRVTFKTEKQADILKAARLGKIQMAEANWIGDYPDGDNFYQLLWSGNRGGSNYAHFSLPLYDQLYLQSRSLGNTPERQIVYYQMNQLIHAYNPWVLRIHPLSVDIWQPWLRNYKRHPVMLTNWRYLDLTRHEVQP